MVQTMTWTRADLTRMIADMRRFGDDFTLIEAKAATGGVPATLPETICAFANMPTGGTVLLGVDQRRGFEVTGVSSPNDMIQAVTSQTRNTVDPAPQITAYPVTVEDRTVVVIEVTGLSPSQKPARHKGRAYLRQSDGDYEMNANDLRMLEIDRLHESERTEYDRTPVTGTTVQDLDSDLLPAYLASARHGSRRLRDMSDADLLRATGVVSDDGSLTRAGLYALGNFPQGTYPSLAVTAAVRLPRDGSGTRTLHREDFDGPLPALLDGVQQWIADNTGGSDVYREDGNMEHRPEFPHRAVRELVANALVHRDLGPNSLGAGNRVQVRVTREELIIVNPGGLHRLSVRELASGLFRPMAVNQRLYEICKHLTTSDGANVIEGEGGGIREVLAATRDAELHRPLFIDRGVDFTVRLPRGAVFTSQDNILLQSLAPGPRLTSVQKALLLSLHEGEAWNIQRMCSEFSPLSRSEAYDQTAALQDRGIVEVTPDGIFLVGAGKASAAATTEQSSPVPGEVASPAGSPGHPTDDARKITRNGPTILTALTTDAGADIKDLIRATGLSRGALHYALAKLVDAGAVIRDGGQGQQETTYRRA